MSGIFSKALMSSPRARAPSECGNSKQTHHHHALVFLHHIYINTYIELKQKQVSLSLSLLSHIVQYFMLFSWHLPIIFLNHLRVNLYQSLAKKYFNRKHTILSKNKYICKNILFLQKIF